MVRPPRRTAEHGFRYNEPRAKIACFMASVGPNMRINMTRSTLAPLGLLPFAILLVATARVAAWPGSVAVIDGELRWGQYGGMKGAVAVEFPTRAASQATLADRIQDYPQSGSAAILLFCQQRGRLFFSADGTAIAEQALEQLRGQLDLICKFDMLPIVVVFDPGVECRLLSSEAYANAARSLAESIPRGVWGLLCLTDQWDSTQWSRGEHPISGQKLVRVAAAAVRNACPNQVIGAGSSRVAHGGASSPHCPPIDVVVRRVEPKRLDELINAPSDRPTIAVLPATDLDKETLRRAVATIGVQRVDDHFPHGVAFHFQGLPADRRGPARDDFLGRLRAVTESIHRDVTRARPPDVGDTHSLQPGEKEEGFVSLFNGKDLSGWIPICKPGNFVVRDGAICTEREMGGYLRSWHAYGDFVFRGQYWIEDGGNSGFFIRAPLVGRESRIGFEFQIFGSSDLAPGDKDASGSIYDVRPPRVNQWKAGQWNDVEITCVGTRVRVRWNGELVHRFRYEDLPFAAYRSTRGGIGLQDHYDRVRFRHLRIRPLSDSDDHAHRTGNAANEGSHRH